MKVIWCPRSGLVPVMALADRAGLSDLVGEHVALAKPGGCNAPVKVSALVAGMVAGADSIDDMGLLRHGGMHRIFGGVRAPSTCGTSCAPSPSGTCCNWRRCRGGWWRT